MIATMTGRRTMIWLMIFGVLAAAPPPQALAGSEGHLRFKKRAEIAKSTYDLGDIAVLDGLSQQLKSRLAGAEIGRTPRPGLWTQVTQSEVAAVLERDLPGVGRRLQWQGPAFIRIRGNGVRCDMGLLQQSARDVLLERLQGKYDQVSIHPVGELKPVVTTAGRVSFHPKLSPGSRLQKRMAVWVDVRVDGRHFQTVPVWFAVTVRMPVWVAQRPISPKQEVPRESVAQDVRDIAGLASDPLTATSLHGLRAARKLSSGKIITTEDVEPIPAVSKGEVITVYASYGTVRLQVKAVALTDGRLSQQIVVKNPGSGESFRATVIGKKLAMVN